MRDVLFFGIGFIVGTFLAGLLVVGGLLLGDPNDDDSDV